MYEEYFGFVQAPFSLTPDPRFLYRSESHDLALQQVWQAIRRKEGFIVLTGDIGTGKTTLCRTLLEQFDATTFTALILNPFLSVEELLREVLLSFGVISKETLRSGRLSLASKHELVRTLHDFLLSLVPLHGSAVLIIDEAQHLSPEVLEEIRVISNLETNEQKLLQIVLVGQLNLLDLLQQANLRQLHQRVSIRCSLKALTRDEVEAYVTHRLFVARGTTPVTFSPQAFDLVHALSGGVPRVINLVCDRALMAGCRAATGQLAEAHVAEAAAQLGIEAPRMLTRRRRFPVTIGRRVAVAAAAAAAVVLLGVTLYAVGNPFDLLGAAAGPVVQPAPAPRLYAALAALPVPEDGQPAGRPPMWTGAFSLVVGTYDNPRALDVVEKQLRARQLPVYTVDISFGPGDLRRRLLVGRYQTREDADEALQKVADIMPGATVIRGELERFRLVIADP
jgi:general secretion pathway protein A